MQQKARVVFSEDGTQLHLVFKNGEKSPLYVSAPDALQAIVEFGTDKKINISEFVEIREEILDAKNLTWEDKSLI